MRRLFLSCSLFLVACVSSVPSPSPPAQTWSVYTPAGGQYSFSYPSTLTVREGQDLMFKDATMHGASFVFPPSMGNGTALREASIHVASGDASLCSQTASPHTLGGEPALEWEWSNADWGWSNNTYADAPLIGTTQEALHNGVCYRLTLFTRSCNPTSNCPPGRTAPFDRLTLLPVYRDVAASFRF
ncbi:hypothetical protein HY213_00030 [Candidatus Peregrinibacteria bacterium]|nr:hypothetical protein [Candidatus Peregrinibacteria bacterium]